jgi:hypothetical protein
VSYIEAQRKTSRRTKEPAHIGVLKDVACDGEGLGPSDPLGTVSHVSNTSSCDVAGPDNVSEKTQGSMHNRRGIWPYLVESPIEADQHGSMLSRAASVP